MPHLQAPWRTHGNGADTYLHRPPPPPHHSACLCVQERFDVDIKPLPEHIDASTYMNTA